MGEEERESGFRAALRRLAPAASVVELSETDGIDERMRELVTDALRQRPDITAVYSIGGANVAIVDAFADLGREFEVFIAHDLDDDNLELIRSDTDSRRSCITTYIKTCDEPVR